METSERQIEAALVTLFESLEHGVASEDIADDVMEKLSHPDDVDDAIVMDTRNFVDAGVMTNNRGLVVTMHDRTEFQITIVQSK